MHHRGNAPECVKKQVAARHFDPPTGLVRSSIAETDDNSECAIDLTKLSKRESPIRFAEPARIDGAELLDEHTRPLTVDFHLRSE